MGKRRPQDMGLVTAPRIPTLARSADAPNAPEGDAPGQLELRARQSARLQKVAVVKLKPHPLQPADRQAEENVRELMESIRAIGLQEPPLVLRRTDGTLTILAGHRRVRAWQLLALSDLADEKMSVLVREDLAKAEELAIIAAEYCHRQEYSLSHTARIIGELWDTWKEETNGEISRRQMTRIVPWEKSTISAYIKVHEALKDPELGWRVQRLDTPDIALLYKILGIADFATKVHALDVYAERGASAAERAIPRSGKHSKPAGKNAGRPRKVVTCRNHAGGAYDLAIRFRPTMTPPEIREALEALEKVQKELHALVTSEADSGVAGSVEGPT